MKGIKKVTFGQYPDNIGYGAVGYRIIASGEEFDIGTVADLIVLLKERRVKTLPNVSLEGFEDAANTQIMYTLCQTLKDWKYQVRVISNGTLYYPWYKLADFLVVHIQDRMSWGRFKGNQIIFPIAPDDLREPDLPPLNGTALFCDLHRLNPDEMFMFLHDATHPWNIFKPYRPTLEWEL